MQIYAFIMVKNKFFSNNLIILKYEVDFFLRFESMGWIESNPDFSISWKWNHVINVRGFCCRVYF